MVPQLRVPFLVLALTLAALASAQVDDRARALLDGLAPPTEGTIQTLDRTMVMTMEAAGGSVTRTRTIIDYVGRRAAVETELAPGMVMTVVSVEGRVALRMAGMTIPAPFEMGALFDGIFDGAGGSLLGEDATATYDGDVDYDGLVAGQQVTVTGVLAIPGLERADVMRFVFDGEGRLLAVVSDTDEGTMLLVYDEPVTGDLLQGVAATMYLLLPAGPERFATLRFENVRVDEPITPGTFD